MRTLRAGLALAVCGALAPAFSSAPASAANSAAFRDCSFAGGLDPDFVQLSGATTGPGQTLQVGQTQPSVTVEASESSDPGDSNGHDTLTVTVSAPGGASRTLSGAGTGSVTLTVPLSGAPAGSSYTISWAATFDNGFHSCPSSQTPNNTTPIPFVLHVVAGATPPPIKPTVTRPRETRRRWRPAGGTTFSFILNEPATVRLSFLQLRRGHRPRRRGGLTVAGKAGVNAIPFKGRLPSGRKLGPGSYRVRIVATDAAGHRSAPVSLTFEILR